LFDLTDEEFFVLTKQNCYYCGTKPSAIIYNSNGNGRSATPYIYNGVDRVDSSKGYTPDNVVPCCKQCNRAKMDMDVKEFLRWARRLGRFQLDGNCTKEEVSLG
jgi:hypothetical protein